MIDELAYELRSAAAFGVVTAVRDEGEEQLVDVEVLPGVVRSGVRVLQPFGFAARPMTDGAVVMLIQVGGDPANLVALPATRPGGRFGKLDEGESVVYGAAGQRIAMRADGSVEVLSATEVRMTCAAGIVLTADTVTINGKLVVTEDISDLNGVHGSLATLRDAYNPHTHAAPGGETGTPSSTTP